MAKVVGTYFLLVLFEEHLFVKKKNMISLFLSLVRVKREQYLASYLFFSGHGVDRVHALRQITSVFHPS